MHYSVCLPAVLSGWKPEDALRAVRNAGYSHYEIWGWWDLDLDALLAAQRENGLSIAALCTRFVPLNDPAMRETYLEGLRETAEICRKLDCPTIITQVGQERTDVSRAIQHESIVEGLKACVPMLREYGLTLTFEPLNTRINHAGYYLWSSEEAFAIAEEVGDPHVKVLYDLYHQYVMEDLKLDRIVENMDKIGHFHMAGYPGRNEPLINSEVDYPTILRAIRESGYAGSVGQEYMPLYPAAEGLKTLYEQLKTF